MIASPEQNLGGLDFSNSAINQSLTADDKIGLYRTMMRIRRFEMVSLKNYNGGKMGGFLHVYNGQESVATSCASLMGEHDHMITAYRCHGHALAAGMNMKECMAELYGKATGCSKGKGGSMHFFAPDKNYWGGHGIVGGQIPLGIGLAYGVKYNGHQGCSLSFLGDGAVNPAIVVIENNGYSMGTSQKRSSAYRDCLAQRAEAYDMAWDLINGEDIYELRAKLHIAMERARKESLPTLLEIQTYRHYGHSIADANATKYRTPEEIQKYKEQHDPISVWEKKLIAEGVFTAEEAKQISKEAMAEATEAAEFAESSPPPTIEDIQKDVYWETDNETEASKIGRHFFND